MLVLIIIISFFSFSANASQPEGLVLKPPVVPMGRRMLRNKNITFVEDDNLNKKVKNQKNEGKVFLKTKYKTKGRSQPGRGGSVVSVIESGEVVEFIKDSADGRWKAVYDKKNDIKVWIPSTALSKKRLSHEDQSSSESSDADLSDEDNSEE